MEEYNFTRDKILVNACESTMDVQKTIEEIFLRKRFLLPQSKNALIFLKPNLNNDQNALMGNSTDLRILVSIITALKKRGYHNIILGDGCNVGIDRKQIDVFSRLKIDKLAQKFDIKLLNLNRAPYREIELERGQKAKVAVICFEAGLFINLPKIKTHAEAQLSLCLKNLIGCLFGGREKKKMHNCLNANIVRLNEQVKPHLHIVDGLIAMEGNGPGNGRPQKMGLLLAGEDPYLIDAFCARLVGFAEDEVPSVNIARKKGHLRETDIRTIRRHPIHLALEKAQPQKLLTRILGHNIFAGLRDAVRPLFDNRPVTRLLYHFGIIQDCYEFQQCDIKAMRLVRSKCTNCGLCLTYCPVSLPITDDSFFFADSRCLQCCYCLWVCPENAIEIEGKLGYLDFHLRRALKHLRSVLS